MAERDPNREPENSTVDDWHGQVGEALAQKADQAMEDAKGDETRAEERFNEATKD